MTTLEILKTLQTRKGEIISKTLDLLPFALSYQRANRTFYFNVDAETGELTVNYHTHAGIIDQGWNCFYTIWEHEQQDPEHYGYKSFREMDFEEWGYREFIEEEIEEKAYILYSELSKTQQI